MYKSLIFNGYLILILALSISISLTSCATTTEEALPQTTSLNASSENDRSPFSGENAMVIWHKLQHTSTTRLAELQKNSQNPNEIAWLELALISKRNSVNTQALAYNLSNWRNKYPSHLGNQLFPNDKSLAALSNHPTPQRLAVLLPQHGTYSSSSRLVREGFLNAYYANLANSGNQNVKFYDTSKNDIASVYQQAINDENDFIIGPLTKNEVGKLKALNRFNAPTLALNYTNKVAALQRTNYYEFGLLPEDETIQIANRAHDAGLSHAIVIAAHNGWGERLVDAFSAAWKKQGGTIADTWLYSPHTNFSIEVAKLMNVDPKLDKQLMQEENDKTVLEQQRRQDFDVIFLFAQPQEARIIVPLLRFYYANNVPIYATSTVYTGKTPTGSMKDLNGVIICDIPWKLRASKQISKKGTQAERLFAVGQDAYILSQTLQRLTDLPNFPIYGKTGALTLDKAQQIHRRLPCTVIRNDVI